MHLSRPSHFISLFLLSLGVALICWGDQLLPSGGIPAEGASGKQAQGSQPRGELIHPGRGDAHFETDASSKAGPTEVAKTDPSSAGSGRIVPDGHWTVFGNVLFEKPIEAAKAAIKDRLASINLELVPLGQGRHAASGMLHGTANQDGHFSWQGLHPGAYRLRALLDDDEQHVLPVAIDFSLSDMLTESAPQKREPARDLQRDVTLTLPRPRLMVGKILNKSRDPRARLLVSVSENGFTRGSKYSDGEGTFQIPRVGRGPYQFTVRDTNGKPVDYEILKAPSEQKGLVHVALVVP